MSRPAERALKSVPAVEETIVPLSHDPVRLVPIPWGQPDSDLARAVFRHLVDATPPIIIPANPMTAAKLRAWLSTNHIEQERAVCPTTYETSRQNKGAGKPRATRQRKAGKAAPLRPGTEGRTARAAEPTAFIPR